MRPRRTTRREEEDREGGGAGGALLVVVSSTGMVVPWPVATLPRYPGDGNRVASPPRPRAAAAAGAAGAGGGAASAGATAGGSTQTRRKQCGAAAGAAGEELHPDHDEEEESEALPRQGPPPSPSVFDAETLLAPFTSLRAWERDTHLLSSGWQPCELNTPSLHSTALLRDELAKAHQATFPSDEINLETDSVLEEAAAAVNIHPLYNVYKNVPPRDSYTLPPPQLVPKATDPRWRAKQERRPTARDFFTPDLEEVLGGGGGRREGGRGGSRRGQQRWVGGREDRERESPYLALYRGAV